MKKVVQSDPKYRDNKGLLRAISIIESYVDGCIDWSSQTRRYMISSKSTNTIAVTRRQLEESDISLIMECFDKKASYDTCNILKQEVISLSEPGPSTSLEDTSMYSSKEANSLQR